MKKINHSELYDYLMADRPVFKLFTSKPDEKVECMADAAKHASRGGEFGVDEGKTLTIVASENGDGVITLEIEVNGFNKFEAIGVIEKAKFEILGSME